MNYDKLTQKKQELDKYRPMPRELVKNLDDWFKIELTYTSNAIEGNTLTRLETAVVIEKGLTVGGKSLKEHLEATNHAKALDFVKNIINQNSNIISAKDILAIHELILKGIDDETVARGKFFEPVSGVPARKAAVYLDVHEDLRTDTTPKWSKKELVQRSHDVNAGQYRNVSIRISGSAVVMPNPRKVPDLMDEFQLWLTGAHNLHPVAFAAEAHYKLVTIHPFVDGNGRTARLLMNLLLMINGYPPAIIRKRDRLAYIGALEKAQLGGSKSDYEILIAKAVDRSLDIYLKAVKGESTNTDLDNDQLLKIGALAKLAEEPTSTIRYWTQEGLLSVAQVTDAGYQLYSSDMLERCTHIKNLKKQRYTLEEIKNALKQ